MSPSKANLKNGDNKHVVINREFAEDESSILSTSNKQARSFDLAFFIGGEQDKRLSCL